MESLSLHTPEIITASILLAGTVDDLRAKKYHNWLFLVSLGVALVAQLSFNGFGGITYFVLGFGAAFALYLPLVVLKVVGAGDLKFLAAFGASTQWQAVLYVGIAAIIWGALFGIVRVIISGQARSFFHNLFAIFNRSQVPRENLHKIPYTFAILMAWLSYLVSGGF